MYHPTIQHLDAAAADFHERGMMGEKNAAHRLAGVLQQKLLERSRFPRTRRFLHPQWCWSLGHIGLLYQLVRWFRLHEPDTRLYLLAKGGANPYFLQALAPFVSIGPLSDSWWLEGVEPNAVYFGCPDGINSLVRFYKLIEYDCRDIHLLTLSDEDQDAAAMALHVLGVKRRPFVALQARSHTHDPARNVTDAQIEAALAPYLARGYSVVSTGLDAHPYCARFPSVTTLHDPLRASFLLSASCDQFIGSNSGAWTMAHAYRRPVELLNDYERAAWIYN